MGTGATAHRGYWAGVGRRLSRDRVAMVCAAILLALVLAALAATGTVGWWGWLGVIPLVTGLIGWCPPYALLGINTCRTKDGPT